MIIEVRYKVSIATVPQLIEETKTRKQAIIAEETTIFFVLVEGTTNNDFTKQLNQKLNKILLAI